MARSARMMISLSAKGRDATAMLAAATGKPMSTIVAELIEEAAPMLEALAKAAVDARSKKTDAYRAVALALAETQLNAAQLSVELHGGKRAKK